MTTALPALRVLTSMVLALAAVSAAAHTDAPTPHVADPDRAIVFPDTAAGMTLVVDLHTHSVFSDGHVWPGVRVGEAIADGLDAVAITEHLEWQPHLEDLPHPDRNRAFEIARDSVPEGSKLIVIAGSEITRRAPHGHMNAVFIEDANALVRPGTPPVPYDPIQNFLIADQFVIDEVLEAANAQGAFVFWNHSWSDFPSRRTELTEFHRKAIEDGHLHGIEVANGATYSPDSFAIALKNNLTPVGVSDVHDLIDWDYTPHTGGHRPVNLVFARERSAAAIRAALSEGRTVVWFRNLLIGREEQVRALLEASLAVTGAVYPGAAHHEAEVTFVNRSDATFELENRSPHTFVDHALVAEIPPHGETTLNLRMQGRPAEAELTFRVLNALVAPDQHPDVTWRVRIDAAAPPPAG